MTRILQVFGRMDRGGAESMIMNIYRSIDRNNIQFDFVVHTDQVCDFDEEIEALGGRIFHIPQFKGYNIVDYINCWKNLFKEHLEWMIVHSHIRSVASIIIPIAKKFGRKTIIHSHSISEESGLVGKIKRLMEYPLRYQSDYFLACSKQAGEWLFGSEICSGEKFSVLNNSIDVNSYAFNESVRLKIRSQLNAEDKILVGHVGRFESPKNHSFLVEILEELVKLNKDVVMVFVGDGSKRQQIEDKINEKNLADNVIFLGLRSDTDNIYQAFDAFVFPSLYEGLGMVLVEAQSSGLQIIASENAVADEINITSLITKLNLSDSPKLWADKILKSADIPHCQDSYKKVIESGFDVNENAEWLEKFYISIK